MSNWAKNGEEYLHALKGGRQSIQLCASSSAGPDSTKTMVKVVNVENAL
jgi:hypothetical protein